MYMANRYYDPGKNRATRVNELFSRIAPRYDLMNDVQSFGLHRYWKGRVLKLARPVRGLKVLDLCCGTGDLALAFAREGAEVVGLDANEPMLEVARNKGAGRKADSAAEGGAGVKFVAGDAQRLPFAESAFDLVTVAYGLRNLADWQQGLCEMQRILRPGGRVMILDFGKPANALWRAIYFAYLRMVIPVLGWIFVGDSAAYSYILESLKHYPAQLGVAAGMRELGLVNVRIVSLLGGAMSINYGEKATVASEILDSRAPARQQ